MPPAGTKGSHRGMSTSNLQSVNDVLKRLYPLNTAAKEAARLFYADSRPRMGPIPAEMQISRTSAYGAVGDINQPDWSVTRSTPEALKFNMPKADPAKIDWSGAGLGRYEMSQLGMVTPAEAVRFVNSVTRSQPEWSLQSKAAYCGLTVEQMTVLGGSE